MSIRSSSRGIDVSESIAVRRKRLLYRCRYRGFLESDLLLERFATRHLESLDGSRLDALEALLEEPDQDIWAWITGASPVPPRHDNDVIALLRATGIGS
jgi:antitoxin CptB